MANRNKKTTQIIYIGMFVALMAICSWICIPTAVPVTLQTFAVFAAISILGLKNSVTAILVYIILGIVGVPVFAGFRGGVGALFSPTGGYVIGFIGTAIVSGVLINKFGKKQWVMFFSMAAGLLVCYIFGTAWILLFYADGISVAGITAVMYYCVIPFVVPDIVKIILAIILDKKVSRFMHLD